MPFVANFNLIMEFSAYISKQLNISQNQVRNTLQLLEHGGTVPFISRYRKEATGSLDEVQIQNIRDLNEKLSELQKRKDYILESVEQSGFLTDELKSKIQDCWNLTELEDIYLPFKPKRKTKAEVARQHGLEPLAKRIMQQLPGSLDSYVSKFINADVPSSEDAIKGAVDIIAEWVNENEGTRNRVRSTYSRNAIVVSKVVKSKQNETDAAKYSDYFDFSEPLKKCSSHRLLAMRRGEAEGFLRVSICLEDELACCDGIKSFFVRGCSPSSVLVSDAVEDAYKRLLRPSIETEFAASSKQKADEEAISVFSENLRQLLLAPPLGQKRVLALDPGFRTGCKVVCLDAQGSLLHHDVIYPHPPHSQVEQAKALICSLINKYKVQAISIGNGTASRETETFVRNIGLPKEIDVFVVSENGASVYSASAVAREEFPNEDVTVRGAVSIGRRLMDPLAELVKIDPKSIGVGQYQHDVDQSKLKKALDQTVISSVNLVGVDVNTASKHLLTYISGLGPQLAQNIVDYRTQNGPITSRKELKKVPRLGDKAFEQCAGFLRISGAKNPLDNSSVHPESYCVVESMANDLQCSVADLMADKNLRSKVELKNYVSDKVGIPTLKDIMTELEKPGRDPRKQIEAFAFSADVHVLEDLRPGMILPGIVTNITNFGAFVDVGVHQDGLVHVSQLSDKYVTQPTDVVSLHQHVTVKVVDVDAARHRIQLTMKGL